MIRAEGLWHYDGHSAIRQRVGLSGDESGFFLTGKAGESGPFAWRDLVRREDGPDGPVFGLKDRSGWRIGFTGAIPDEIAAHVPRPLRYGGWIDRFGLWRASGAFLLVSSIVAALVLKAPDWLAPNIPFSWEKRMGDAMVGDLGGRICNASAGQAALDRLAGQIDKGKPALRVRVANVGLANAVALPGGNIIVFRGLLQEAGSPDELAGVIAHEIGHVRNRHVVQALMRQAGLSILLGGLGGNSGNYLNSMLAASYSREAESAADSFAIARLRSARISPDDTADFFKRLAAQEAKLGNAAAALGYVSTHPLSRSRERAFRGSRQAGLGYHPALDEAQWTALTAICRNDPDVADDDGLLL